MSNAADDFIDSHDTAKFVLRQPLLHHDEDMSSSRGQGMRQRVASNMSFQSGDIEQEHQYLQSSSNSRGRQRQRILDRGGNFRQSRGRWGVDRQINIGDTPEWCCQRMYQEWGKDWFFWLAYQKTYVLFLLLFLSYGFIIMFFGFIYLGLSVFGSKAEVNPDGSTKTIAFCDMDINDHMEAMYFSLSTMTTIGYGVSDYYFGGCYSPLLIVLWQVCTAIVFDAVAVGLIFHRISRGAKRSRSILFSDKAIIRCIRGVPYFMFRLGERRKYNLIDATVRCYCVCHDRIPLADSTTLKQSSRDARVRIETVFFISRRMKLVQPDSRFGSHVWMGLPQVVVHRIDQDSPLLPPSLWFDVEGVRNQYPPSGGTSENESVATFDPLATCTQSNEAELRAINRFLHDRDAELLVLVEGTDEGTGQNIQARHSYKTCDIAWNSTFADCVYPYNRRQRRGPSILDPVATVDFSKFHDLIPAPLDCESCAFVPQSIR